MYIMCWLGRNDQSHNKRMQQISTEGVEDYMRFDGHSGPPGDV